MRNLPEPRYRGVYQICEVQARSCVVIGTFGSVILMLKYAASLQTLPVGEWVGPVASAFGAHDVRVVERTPETLPALADIRDEVVREWENDRRQRARTAQYNSLRHQYDVVVQAKIG